MSGRLPGVWNPADLGDVLEVFRRCDSALHYFTLEHGIDITTGNDITMLCEWTAAGDHVNYGKGPAPTLEAFITAVRAKLAGH